MAEKIQVIYVDDEQNLLELCKVYLERSGDFTVTIVPGAPEALRLLEKERFDAIVSDYQMPEMDGIEFLKHVRATDKSIPFIIFTGKGREEVAITAFENGADFYIQKGGEPKAQFAELVHKIKRAVDHRTDEKASLESEERFRQLFSRMPSGVAIYKAVDGGEDFVFRNFNATAEAIEHVKKEDVIGKRVTEVFPGVKEFGIFSVFKRVWRTGKPEYFPSAIYRDARDPGTWRENWVYRLQTGDIVAIYNDITERKWTEGALRDSEEKYRELTEKTNDIIYSIDLTGRITYVSPQISRYGFKPEEIVSKNLTSFVEEEDHILVLEDFKLTISTGQPIITTFRIRDKSGNIRWMEDNGTAIFDKTNKIIGISGILRDITERKQAESALRQSEEKFRSIVETSPDIIWEIDPQGIFRYISPQIQEVMGYSPKELIGKSITDLVPEQAKSAIRQELEHYGSLKESLSPYVVTSHHRDGREIILEIRPSLTGMDGKREGFRGVAVDITERKRTEEALQIKEHQLTSIFNNISDILFFLSVEPDNRFRFVSVNQHFLDATGLSENQVAGRYVDEVIPEPSLSLVLENYNQAIRENKTVQWFEVTPYPSGTKHGHVAITPICDENGRCTNLVGSVHDITGLKQAEEALRKSEEQYHSLLEHVPELLLVHRNGVILYTNPAMAKSLGYQPHEAINRNITDFIAPEYHERVAAAMRRRMEGVPVAPYEIEVMSREGNRRTMIINGNQIVFKGMPANLIVLVDITERKVLHDAVTVANKKLNLMSSITRHDIINQLSALEGHLELSRDLINDPVKMEEYITKEQNIVRTIETQIRFTKDYQDLGVKAPEWQNVHDSVVRAREIMSLRGIVVETESPTLEVYADPLITKVFYNLMDNAVRHGGKQLKTIRFSGAECNNAYCIICEDDGIGIPIQEKEKIFKRGYGKNTGLGLFLVREILAITGITIMENGMQGKGTRFEITVPKGMWRNKEANTS